MSIVKKLLVIAVMVPVLTISVVGMAVGFVMVSLQVGYFWMDQRLTNMFSKMMKGAK